MAITTYDELKSTIADFLNRDDLTAVIPDFISLAEARVNREVRHWRMEKRATAALDTQFTSLPSDFLEGIRLTLNTSNTKPLELVGNFEIATIRAEVANTAGQPQYYSIMDGAIEVVPTPDTSYTLEILYYGSVNSLNSSNTTNWLLTYHPDVLLYGALLHSAPYLSEDARIPIWGAYYTSSVESLNQESQKSKSGGAGRRMKIRSY